MAIKLKGKKSMYCNSKLRLFSILMLIAPLGLMTQVQASDNDNKDTSTAPPPPGPYRIVPTDTPSPAIVNRAMPPQQRSMQQRNMPPQGYDQQRYVQQRPPIAPMYQQNSKPPVMPRQYYWNTPPARSYAMPPQVPQQRTQPPQHRDWNAYPKIQTQPPVASKQQLQPQTQQPQSQQQAKQPLAQQQGNWNANSPRYVQPPPAWGVRPAPVQPQWGQPQYAPPRRTIPQQQYTPGYRSAPPWGYVPQNTRPPAANWQRPAWGYAPRY